jgi:hypothetical protein
MTGSNYSAIAKLHILQITAANTTSSPVCNVFTRRFLVAASNSRDSLASALTLFPADHYLTTEPPTQLTLCLANISVRTQFPLFHAYPLPWERVYLAVAQKWVWYIHPSRGHCIATALHTKIL